MTAGKSPLRQPFLPDAESGAPRPRLGFAVKLAIGFGLVLTLLGGTGVTTVRSLARVVEEHERSQRLDVEDVILAERLRSAEDSEAAAGRGYLLTRDPDFLERLEEAELAFDRAYGDLRQRVTSQEGADLLESVASAAADYTRTQHAVLVVSADGAPSAEIRRLFERDVVPKRRSLSEAIDSFVAHKERRLRGESEVRRAATSSAVLVSGMALALALVASAVLALLMGRHLANLHGHEGDARRAAIRALAARDQLLGIVAHDLRSPLSAITIRAGMLAKAIAGETLRASADAIVRIAMRMEDIVKSLLDAASIESGKFSVSPAPCDVEEMLREAATTFEGLATPKSIRVEARAAQAGLAVMADRVRVGQVLTNLVGNAIKFTFEGGKITVAAERTGGEVRFSVADTGPGIALAHLPHVFDRFWKADAGGLKGTGLGLFIAKGIVEAHGGSIWAESQLGSGATFHFTLPFTDAGTACRTPASLESN